MAAYVDYPYAGEDLDDVLAAALTRLAETLPGWTPRETHLEYALLAEVLRHILDTRLLAADVAKSVFREYGAQLIQLPRNPGTPATGTVTFQLTDTTGRTVPAGTGVLWGADPASGDGRLFLTVADTTAAPDSSTTPPVQVAAAEPGEDGNGLPAGSVDVVDALAFVAGATATTSSAGGTDPEQDADYLDRLADSLQLLRRIPVLAGDFAVLARDVPGVHRALGLDGYNAQTGQDGQERTVSVAAVDSAGQPLAPAVAEALRARLDGEREVNFVVQVLAPTYTALTVRYTVNVDRNADPAAVRADVTAAVRDYLSPARWAGGDERPPVWRLERVVRYLDLVGVVFAVPGVANVTDVTLNGGRVDVTLNGPAPLPGPGPADVDGTAAL